MIGRTCSLLWPGLTGVWLRGSWLDLATAAAFAAALNFALLTTFVWPQLVSRELTAWAVPTAAWVLVLWFWVVGRGGAARQLAIEAAKSLQPDEVSNTLLAEAQTEYLKGHWLEAKSRLVRLLSRRPGDAEARLLLVSVYRRSGEIELARQQLTEVMRMPTALRWLDEIDDEQKKLARAASMKDEPRASTREPVAARAA